MEKDEVIKEKVAFYKESKIALHLTLSSNKRGRDGLPLKKWANGKVSEIHGTHFVFEEEKLGRVIVFFKEVIELEPRKERQDNSYYGYYGAGEGVCKEEVQKAGGAYKK